MTQPIGKVGTDPVTGPPTDTDPPVDIALPVRDTPPGGGVQLDPGGKLSLTKASYTPAEVEQIRNDEVARVTGDKALVSMTGNYLVIDGEVHTVTTAWIEVVNRRGVRRWTVVTDGQP